MEELPLFRGGEGLRLREQVLPPAGQRQEVLARIKAILRRTSTPTAKAKIEIGAIEIDFERKMVTVRGEDIHLSPKEFGIFSLLAKNPKRVFTREEILSEVWHGESYVLDRTVDVHVARIRRKLGDEASCLTNRQGYGYCLVP